MGLEKEKREFLVQHIGEERAAKLEEMLPTLSKELEEAGVNFKELVASIVADPDPEPKPTGEGNGDGGDPDPYHDRGDPEEKTESIKALKEAVTEAVKAVTDPMAVTIKSLQDEITELKKSYDEKIAAAIGPKTNVAAAAAAKRPTDDRGNIIDETKGLEPDPSDSTAQNGQPGSATARARELVDTFLLGKR